MIKIQNFKLDLCIPNIVQTTCTRNLLAKSWIFYKYFWRNKDVHLKFEFYLCQVIKKSRTLKIKMILWLLIIAMKEFISFWNFINAMRLLDQYNVWKWCMSEFKKTAEDF